jgi:hypothetical protein
LGWGKIPTPLPTKERQSRFLDLENLYKVEYSILYKLLSTYLLRELTLVLTYILSLSLALVAPAAIIPRIITPPYVGPEKLHPLQTGMQLS